MTDTEHKLARPRLVIELEPDGLWSRQRFDFCNALEDVCDLADSSAAVQLLKSLGVHIRESAGDPRSAVPGQGER